MTRNTRTIPIDRLPTPAFVEYDGRTYRAWRKLPLAAPLSGIVLEATDTSGQRHGLLYASTKAPVLVVIG